jgi:hypothetical protein
LGQVVLVVEMQVPIQVQIQYSPLTHLLVVVVGAGIMDRLLKHQITAALAAVEVTMPLKLVDQEIHHPQTHLKETMEATAHLGVMDQAVGVVQVLLAGTEVIAVEQ